MRTHHAPLTAWLDGIGCLGPGLADWPAARAALCGETAYTPAPTVLPAPTLLPPAERRRASRVVKVTLAAGLEAAAHGGAEAATLATVFTASGADGHNCHALCEQLATDDRQISPTRFHNSVHNAAAGYWGIATGAMAPCQVIGAHDASFGAGFIDALGQVAVDRRPVLLVAYDSEYPAPLFATRPVPDVGAVGLLLSPEPSPRSLARLSADLVGDPPDHLANPQLEALRQSIPALRALPLLDRLARGQAGRVVLDYLPSAQLAVDIAPCPRR